MVKYSNAAFALVALFAALSMGPTPANGLTNMQPIVRRHHHIGNDKLVRKIKRQGGIPILGGGDGTGTTGAATNTNTATAKTSDATKASDTAKASNTSDNSKPSNTSNTNTASTDSASKSSASNTSASNTSNTNTVATNTPTVTPPPSATNTGPSTSRKPTVFITTTAGDTAPTNTDTASTTSAFSARTWIILGSIVGGIIVIAALWTVIRKWKFSPSRKFEDRLEPIDWQPEQSAATGAAAGAAGGAALARSNSHGSQRSNPTADEYHNRHMYAPNAAPEYPPDMYGGAAYADMHRGGTPQPQMDQLGHGPVYARGPYDGYDNGPAPYHQHQHAQDPYGGYAEQEYGAPAGPYRGY